MFPISVHVYGATLCQSINQYVNQYLSVNISITSQSVCQYVNNWSIICSVYPQINHCMSNCAQTVDQSVCGSVWLGYNLSVYYHYFVYFIFLLLFSHCVRCVWGSSLPFPFVRKSLYILAMYYRSITAHLYYILQKYNGPFIETSKYLTWK